MTTAYATDTQLNAYLAGGSVPVQDASRLLRRASELIDELVLSKAWCVFATDDDGNPTDSLVVTALADAVCAQVEQWLEVGEENDIDGLAGDQVTLTGFSGHRAPTVAPRAVRHLRRAGLLTPGAVSISSGVCC